MKKSLFTYIATASLILSLALSACSMNSSSSAGSTVSETSTSSAAATSVQNTEESATITSQGEYDGTAVFSENGVSCDGTLSQNGSVVTISSAGTYLITGSSSSGQIVVDADKDDQVTLILEDLTLKSTDGPAIYAKHGTLTIVLTGDSKLEDTTNYTLEADSDEPNACIYSKDSLTISGTGSLTVNGNYYIGIESKDDLVIEDGTLTVTSADDAIRGHDSVTVTGGTLDLTAGADGIKSNNDSDSTLGTVTITGGTITITSEDDGIDAVNDITVSAGTIVISSSDDAIHTDTSVYISGGDITIDCQDDAIHAEADLSVTGGTLDLSGHEGLEACTIVIDDGKITINANDDAANATYSNGTTVPSIEINGGELNITVAQGDTDALDSNGNLIINGGTVNISAQSPFDFDGQGQLNGGTVYVNGTQITSLTNQMMGGMGGQMMDPSQGGFGQNGEAMPGNMMPGGMNGGRHG